MAFQVLIRVSYDNDMTTVFKQNPENGYSQYLMRYFRDGDVWVLGRVSLETGNIMWENVPDYSLCTEEELFQHSLILPHNISVHEQAAIQKYSLNNPEIMLDVPVQLEEYYS